MLLDVLEMPHKTTATQNSQQTGATRSSQSHSIAETDADDPDAERAESEFDSIM